MVLDITLSLNNQSLRQQLGCCTTSTIFKLIVEQSMCDFDGFWDAYYIYTLVNVNVIFVGYIFQYLNKKLIFK